MEILHFLSSKSAAYKREQLQIKSGLWWRAYGIYFHNASQSDQESISVWLVCRLMFTICFQAESQNQTLWFHINQIKPNEFRKPQNSPNGHLVLYCYTANWILALHSHQRKNKPLMGVGFALLWFALPYFCQKKVSNQA